MASSQIQHFTHPHLLHKRANPAAFRCNGCNTFGFGFSYQCVACDFDLHEECATASFTISSHHHPQHHLTLVNRPGKVLIHNNYATSSSVLSGIVSCNVCGESADGISYTCAPCGFYAHPLCTRKTTVVSSSLPWHHSSPNHHYNQHPQYYQQQHQYQQPHNHRRSFASNIASTAGKIFGNILLSSIGADIWS